MYIYYIYFIDIKEYKILEVEDELTTEDITGLCEYIPEKIEVYDNISNAGLFGLIYKNY